MSPFGDAYFENECHKICCVSCLEKHLKTLTQIEDIWGLSIPFIHPNHDHREWFPEIFVHEAKSTAISNWNFQSLFPIDHLYRPRATRSSAFFPQDLTKLANSLDLRMEALLREHEQAGTLVGWWVLWAGGQGWLSEMKGFWETKMETQPLIWNTW